MMSQTSILAPDYLAIGSDDDFFLTPLTPLTTRGKVAIYGWHKPDGKPIHPLYMGHAASHVDYSHGIRLVSRRMMVDGLAKTIEEVLADPERAPLLSNEGVMLQTRYRRTDFAPSLKAAPSASSRRSSSMPECGRDRFDVSFVTPYSKLARDLARQGTLTFGMN
jgi:hypothetical protein